MRENRAWYVVAASDGKSFALRETKLEKYVGLITLSRAALLMTIHGGLFMWWDVGH